MERLQRSLDELRTPSFREPLFQTAGGEWRRPKAGKSALWGLSRGVGRIGLPAAGTGPATPQHCGILARI